jgi:hypothetical protein
MVNLLGLDKATISAYDSLLPSLNINICPSLTLTKNNINSHKTMSQAILTLFTELHVNSPLPLPLLKVVTIFRQYQMLSFFLCSITLQTNIL